MPPSSQNPTRPFVGRGAQLAVVSAHVADLERQRGGLVLLTGEPGIGKTRLAEEIVGLGRERGVRTVWATAWQGDGAPPLWPWVQVLRQLAGSAETLAHFMAESPGASPAARFAQSEAVANVIRAETVSDPILVVIDDLQWVDSATIRVLAAVVAQLRDVGCLFVGTYRTAELAGEHVAELARVGVTLAVPSLSSDEGAELLNIAVGSIVSPAARDSIIVRSGGNPLFVWEFGQLLAQSGRFDVAPAAVPVAVAAVIGRRLARLSEDAVVLLRAGAIAGNPFTADVVAGITQLGLGDVMGGLTAAAAVGLIVHADSANEYRFSHDLIREVVLDGIDPMRRGELHLGAASAFEERLRVDDSFHAVVADHLEQAGPIYAEAAAAEWEIAARRAQRVLAFDEAALCFARAACNCLDNRRVAVLLVEEGEALLLAGELENARARFLASAKLARSVAEPELLARSVLGMGAGAVAWEVPIASSEQALLVADALERLPADAIALRSMLLARLSVAAATPETVPIARQRASEALELAQSADDPALIAQALAAVNDAYAGPTHTMTRRDNADTIVELAVVAGDRVLELLGYRYRIVADLEVGDISAVDRNIAAFTRLAEQLRQPLVSWYVPLFRGMRALLGGDLDGADRWCAEVASAADATASHNAAMMAVTLALGIDVSRGKAPDPAALDGLFEVDPAEWASYAAGLALVHWLAGDRDRARYLLRLHAGNGFDRLGEDGEQLTTLLMFGRVATGLEEVAACEALYELLLPHADLWAVDGIAGCCWGPIELELGRLALALGRRTDAVEHLGRARASAERVGAPLISVEAASLEQRCGRLDAAQNEAAEVGVPEANLFRRDGQFWTLSYRGRTVRMKDAKGLQDLARLISMPGHELHVLDLAGSRSGSAPYELGRPGDLGDVLDARARAEYRRRLAELDDELGDAEQFADLGRADKARAERDFIAAELAAALGIGGRPRRTGDPAERARKAVAGRIRLTIGRIDAEAPDLARHLANAVHTGTFCVYRPEVPIDWTV